jgi:threonine/homoserine/homoserine lactone efflux protein
MGNAIGQVLPLAIGVALSPLPIIAVVLMLVTTKGRVNGPAFVIGWLVGLAVVGAIVLLVAGPTNASQDSQPATWVNWLKLLLGAGALLIAVKQWQGRPHKGEQAESPKWMSAIDGFTPPKSVGAGALLAGANPKNLLLSVAAAASIASTGISGTDQAVAYAVFALIGTIGVGAPVVIYFAMGDRSGPLLDRLKAWMGANNAVIMVVLLLVIGAKLIGDAISGFSS